jgi:hypothetical protein
MASVLALGELAAEYAMRDKRHYIAVTSIPQRAVVYGMYEAYSGDEESVLAHRRVTGGEKAVVGEDWTYIAAALPGKSDLRQLASLALGARACLRGVVGFTHFQDVGFLEGFSPVPQEDAVHCFEEVLGGTVHGRIRPPRMNINELARLFRSDSWRLYRYRPGSGEEYVRRNGSYWIRLSFEVIDGYIADYSLTGVFYSAPPSEIYSVFSSVKGTPFNELVLYNIEIGIESRLDMYGITIEDLVTAVRKLYERLGEK